MKLALYLSCAPAALIGISSGATLMPMPTVKVDTVLSASGSAPTTGAVPISTGAVRATSTAPPTNGIMSARVSPEISGSPRSAAAEEGTSSGRQAAAREEAPSAGRQSAATAEPSNRSAASAASRKGGAPLAAPSSKDAIAPAIVYDDPGAFHFSAEAGYASKHIWRGIDLPQFTSYNYLDPQDCPKADSDVTYIGASATYKGFLFGIKYIETIDDNFNPFFAPSPQSLDSYSELVLSVNYTRMLVGEDMLQGTLGLDFYYYPNDEFWGVSNQGMLYLRLACPHYKWAQPFVELFYNFAIDSSGAGLARSDLNVPLGKDSFRGATGSELVEGMGFEVGVNGGDRIYSNDNISVALTYSISTFFKSGYAFEDDGFSQLVMTVGAPITIGSHLTITPSVSYVEALSDISPDNDALVPGGGSAADVWNSPGWVAMVKASWQF